MAGPKQLLGGFLAALAVSFVVGPAMATARSTDTAKRLVKPHTFFTKLVVSDLDKSAVFYARVFQVRELLRLKSTMDHRPMSEVMFKFANDEAVPLVLIKYLDGTEPTHGQAVPVYFTEDLDGFLARVEANGGRIGEIRDEPEHKARVAFFRDPEGNLIEIVQMGR